MGFIVCWLKVELIRVLGSKLYSNIISSTVCAWIHEQESICYIQNCRIVNQQDIDRDREVCLYWAICNMIWKLSWCTYGNSFVNLITKTKIAPSSHSPISTKLALLWSALPKCLKPFVPVCVWQVILSSWYYPLRVVCSFERHHTGMFTEEQSWENWSHFHWCLRKKRVEKYLQFLNIFLKFLWKSETEWNSEEIN
jgi:hypothetical protein